MTIEQKAIAYDSIFERLKKMYNSNKTNVVHRIICERYFPELKESEDEKIRKWCVNLIKATCDYDSPTSRKEVDDAIAWLEKQCEQNKFFNVPSREVILSIWDLGNEWKELTKGSISTEYGTQLDYIQKHWQESEYYLRAKQGEQKPADKNEPKFKNGQWIVWQDKCYKVNYNGCGYELVDQNGLSTSLEYGTIDENAHLWDITKDAKDGDVLVSQYGRPFIYNDNRDSILIGSYCGISVDGNFVVSTEKCHWTENMNIHPATKEQRDALTKAMTDAGYTFDFEKKELKKIEQKPTDAEMKELLRTEYEKGRADAIAETQVAWSEDDSKKIETLSSIIFDYAFYKDALDENYDLTGEYIELDNWLKALKQRITNKQ